MLYSLVFSQSPIIVAGQKNVYSYKLDAPIKDQTGHGDGESASIINGIVIDGSTLKPIPFVKITVARHRTLAQSFFQSDYESDFFGEFAFGIIWFTTYTIVKGVHKVQGVVPVLATFSSSGYHDVEVSLDFEMPPMIILMKRK
jgi:hypothetical protein